MKRILSVVLSLIIIVGLFSGCSSKSENIRVLCIENSPSALLANIFNGNSKNAYTPKTVNLPNYARTAFTDNECDIAIIPIETAHRIYKLGQTKIKVIAGISTGGFEIVSTENITKAEDLKNHDVYLTEPNTVLECIFKYALKLNNINADNDLQIQTNMYLQEISENMANGTIKTAVLTSAEACKIKSEVKNVSSINLTDIISQKIKKPSIITYCVVASNDFIEKNPGAIKRLLKDIETSLAKSKKDLYTLAVKQNIISSEIYTEALLDQFKADFISGEKMQTKLTAYFTLLQKYGFTIGGKTPEDDFYYIG